MTNDELRMTGRANRGVGERTGNSSFGILHSPLELVLSRGFAPRTSAFAGRRAGFSLHLESVGIRGRTCTGYGLLEGQAARAALHSRTRNGPRGRYRTHVSSSSGRR